MELVYFFFDDTVMASAPNRLAYLFQSWPLPGDVGGAARFSPELPVEPVTPSGTGDANTYAVFLTFYDGDSLASAEHMFVGVGLPELAGHLRSADPGGGDGWPPELLVLEHSSRPERTPSDRRWSGATGGPGST